MNNKPMTPVQGPSKPVSRGSRQLVGGLREDLRDASPIRGMRPPTASQPTVTVKKRRSFIRDPEINAIPEPDFARVEAPHFSEKTPEISVMEAPLPADVGPMPVETAPDIEATEKNSMNSMSSPVVDEGVTVEPVIQAAFPATHRSETEISAQFAENQSLNKILQSVQVFAIPDIEFLCSRLGEILVERKRNDLMEKAKRVQEFAAQAGIQLDLEQIMKTQGPTMATAFTGVLKNQVTGGLTPDVARFPVIRRSRYERIHTQIKYQNPLAADENWTGRGRMPLWLKHRIEQGASKSDFLVA